MAAAAWGSIWFGKVSDHSRLGLVADPFQGMLRPSEDETFTHRG